MPSFLISETLNFIVNLLMPSLPVQSVNKLFRTHRRDPGAAIKILRLLPSNKHLEDKGRGDDGIGGDRVAQ